MLLLLNSNAETSSGRGKGSAFDHPNVKLVLYETCGNLPHTSTLSSLALRPPPTRTHGRLSNITSRAWGMCEAASLCVPDDGLCPEHGHLFCVVAGSSVMLPPFPPGPPAAGGRPAAAVTVIAAVAACCVTARTVQGGERVLSIAALQQQKALLDLLDVQGRFLWVVAECGPCSGN